MYLRVNASDGLNLREYCRVTAPKIKKLDDGTQVQDFSVTVVNGENTWRFVFVDGVYGWVADAYLAPITPSIPPVVVPPAPTTAAHAIGIHVHYNADATMILAMVDRLLAKGKCLACVTVVSNVELANALAQRGITVMFRMVWGDYELYNPSMLDGLTPAQAEQAGYNFYFGNHWPIHQQLDKRVILKFVNERGYHAVVGNDFWIRLMKAADEDNRKLAIFGDSVGTPEVADYALRAPALRYAAAHGHYVTLNEYGRFDNVNGQQVEGDHPVSDDEAYPYFGGRHELFYDAVPSDCRPRLIIGETGPSHSSVTHSREFIRNDVRRYNAKLMAGKYAALIIGYSYFTFGRWKECSLDPYADEFEQAVMEA